MQRYSKTDLDPTVPDPRCSAEFPVANFWPVYVGNFRCELASTLPNQVQIYFASKGLLVRMVYRRSGSHDLHYDFQRKYGFCDFLAYFVREEDAKAAVARCHRDQYFGSHLNVFPGREPVYFDVTRSVKYMVMGRYARTNEYSIETYMRKRTKAKIDCVVRHTPKKVFIEYTNAAERDKAIQLCILFAPERVVSKQLKQRFLECEIEQEIREHIAKHPDFMKMCPKPTVLNHLFNRSRSLGEECEWRGKAAIIDDMRLHLPAEQFIGIRKRVARQALEQFGITTAVPREKKRAKRRREMQQQAANEGVHLQVIPNANPEFFIGFGRHTFQMQQMQGPNNVIYGFPQHQQNWPYYPYPGM